MKQRKKMYDDLGHVSNMRMLCSYQYDRLKSMYPNGNSSLVKSCEELRHLQETLKNESETQDHTHTWQNSTKFIIPRRHYLGMRIADWIYGKEAPGNASKHGGWDGFPSGPLSPEDVERNDEMHKWVSQSITYIPFTNTEGAWPPIRYAYNITGVLLIIFICLCLIGSCCGAGERYSSRRMERTEPFSDLSSLNPSQVGSFSLPSSAEGSGVPQAAVLIGEAAEALSSIKPGEQPKASTTLTREDKQRIREEQCKKKRGEWMRAQRSEGHTRILDDACRGVQCRNCGVLRCLCDLARRALTGYPAYWHKSDPLRQFIEYDDVDEWGVLRDGLQDGNLYRTLAVIGPDFWVPDDLAPGHVESARTKPGKYCHDVQFPEDVKTKVLLPTMVGYVQMVLLVCIVLTMQLVIPWTLLYGDWGKHHIAGVRRLDYFFQGGEKGFAASTSTAALLAFSFLFLVTVEKQIRQEISFCAEIFTAISHNGVRYHQVMKQDLQFGRKRKDTKMEPATHKAFTQEEFGDQFKGSADQAGKAWKDAKAPAMADWDDCGEQCCDKTGHGLWNCYLFKNDCRHRCFMWWKSWSYFWVAVSFGVNLYVGVMLTLYVVHSIAVYDPAGDNDVMNFMLMVVGSAALLDFDDEFHRSLPMWTAWYDPHFYLTNEFLAGWSLDSHTLRAFDHEGDLGAIKDDIELQGWFKDDPVFRHEVQAGETVGEVDQVTGKAETQGDTHGHHLVMKKRERWREKKQTDTTPPVTHRLKRNERRTWSSNARAQENRCRAEEVTVMFCIAAACTSALIMFLPSRMISYNGEQYPPSEDEKFQENWLYYFFDGFQGSTSSCSSAVCVIRDHTGWIILATLIIVYGIWYLTMWMYNFHIYTHVYKCTMPQGEEEQYEFFAGTLDDFLEKGTEKHIDMDCWVLTGDEFKLKHPGEAHDMDCRSLTRDEFKLKYGANQAVDDGYHSRKFTDWKETSTRYIKHYEYEKYCWGWCTREVEDTDRQENVEYAAGKDGCRTRWDEAAVKKRRIPRNGFLCMLMHAVVYMLFKVTMTASMLLAITAYYIDDDGHHLGP